MSRLPSTLPLTELAALCDAPDIGVCGGVVNGGGPEFVAVTDGTEPRMGVGLFTTVEGDGLPTPNEALERGVTDSGGLAGRLGTVAVAPAGSDATPGFVWPGEAIVGVWRGVLFVEDMVVKTG